jgi:predicted HicB family RNase H-like nuclease
MAKELEKEFHKSVDEYQKFCLEMKRIPEKPFSG